MEPELKQKTPAVPPPQTLMNAEEVRQPKPIPPEVLQAVERKWHEEHGDLYMT